MKKALLLLFVAGAVNAQAQKKMIGTTSYYYDNTGVVQFIDSNSYQYSTSGGDLTSSEPKFAFLDPIYDWVFEVPLLLCDSERHFSGNSLPLLPTDTTLNTIINGRVIQRESTYDRDVYMYDANGNVTSLASYYFDGTNWVQSQEETSEYDANQNRIVRNLYDYSSGSPVHTQSDTLSYNASNLPISSTQYEYDEMALEWYAYYQSLITYSGTEVISIQLFEGDLFNPLTQLYDVDYTYTSGKPTKLEAFEYIGGVPQTPAVVEYDYTYGANQKVSAMDVIFSGDIATRVEYNYDAQGFVTEVINKELDFSTSMLYVSLVDSYYYASTAGVDENTQAIFSVYPNPVQDLLTISSTEKVENVKVFSVNGKIMIEQKSNSVDVSILPSGSYIAKVQTASGVSSVRFVKN